MDKLKATLRSAAVYPADNNEVVWQAFHNEISASPLLISQSEQALTSLRELDDKAGGNPDLETQIQDATTALGTLRLQEVQADQVKIDKASQQLATVTEATNAAIADLSKIIAVIETVAGFVNLLQGVASIII